MQVKCFLGEKEKIWKVYFLKNLMNVEEIHQIV